MELNDLLPNATLNVARESADWIRDHSISALDLTEFWQTLSPLVKALHDWTDGPLVWTTASAMRGPIASFHPQKCDYSISNEQWEYRHAIEHLSAQQAILHTTQICLSFLRDGSLLQIHADDNDKVQRSEAIWHLHVGKFSQRFKKHQSAVEKLVAEIAKFGFNHQTVEELDRLFRLRRNPRLTEPTGGEDMAPELSDFLAERQYKLLYRYLAIASTICPDWYRITMLPAIFPAGHLTFPGGFVICELNRPHNLSDEDLINLQTVASVPYWPWQLTARSSNRERFTPTIKSIVNGSNNDYRRIEHLFGGELYTLTDRQLNFFEDSEIPMISGRTRERRKRINNITSRREENRLKISVIIPFLPAEDRIHNFNYVLEALNAQSIHQSHSDQFELVVVQNGRVPNGSAATAFSITALVKNFDSLNAANCRIITSDRQLGRSSARNVGIKECTGHIVQLLDDSIVLHKDYLLEVLVRFEHLRGQKMALLGFKERGPDQEEERRARAAAIIEGDWPSIDSDFKVNEKPNRSFSYSCRRHSRTTFVNYMKMTGDLCFLSGADKLGHRSLTKFFTTALVAVPKSELINVGGFDHEFDEGWGFEDTFVGAKLIARGNCLVPCYSMRALDLPHKKDNEKKSLKEQKVPKIDNEEVLEYLLQRKLGYFSEKSFEINLSRLKSEYE